MRILMTAFLIAGVAAGCGKKDGGADKAAATPAKAGAAKAGTSAAPAAQKAGDAMAEAKTLFAQRCATCHGNEGKGDGPAGKALNPPARSFSDPEFVKRATDDHLAKVIVGGGTAVGLSPLMAPNPDLKDKPEVVKALSQLVKDMGK